MTSSCFYDWQKEAAQQNGQYGLCGGLVVSAFAFYSDDPSSIPAEVYNFSVNLLLKRTKINKKRPGLAHLKKTKWKYFIGLVHALHVC